jgi:hypothetical protein
VPLWQTGPNTQSLVRCCQKYRIQHRAIMYCHLVTMFKHVLLPSPLWSMRPAFERRWQTTSWTYKFDTHTYTRGRRASVRLTMCIVQLWPNANYDLAITWIGKACKTSVQTLWKHKKYNHEYITITIVQRKTAKPHLWTTAGDNRGWCRGIYDYPHCYCWE